MLEALYIDLIGDTLYWTCVHIIQVIGDKTGMGYQLANLVIFIFLQPGLILLFFILWSLHAYFRQEYGLQNKVARLAGYNTSVFSKYITGRRRLPIGFVEHVLPYTTLTLNGLLNQKDN